MTKEIFLKRWKESENWTQVQKPLVFDYIHAKEIIYVAYKVGFINWNVYSLAMDRKNKKWELDVYETGRNKSL